MLFACTHIIDAQERDSKSIICDWNKCLNVTDLVQTIFKARNSHSNLKLQSLRAYEWDCIIVIQHKGVKFQSEPDKHIPSECFQLVKCITCQRISGDTDLFSGCLKPTSFSNQNA